MPRNITCYRVVLTQAILLRDMQKMRRTMQFTALETSVLDACQRVIEGNSDTKERDLHMLNDVRKSHRDEEIHRLSHFLKMFTPVVAQAGPQSAEINSRLIELIDDIFLFTSPSVKLSL